jgi:uncharacterized protein
MRTMAQLFQLVRPPAEVMALTAAEDKRRGRNRPCPCGSRRRFRSCHGNNAPHSPFSGVSPVTNPPQDVSAMPMRADSPLQIESGPAQRATM